MGILEGDSKQCQPSLAAGRSGRTDGLCGATGHIATQGMHVGAPLPARVLDSAPPSCHNCDEETNWSFDDGRQSPSAGGNQ
jgi:hypothetical protein